MKFEIDSDDGTILLAPPHSQIGKDFSILRLEKITG
jgi:hypothetical protein